MNDTTPKISRQTTGFVGKRPIQRLVIEGVGAHVGRVRTPEHTLDVGARVSWNYGYARGTVVGHHTQHGKPWYNVRLEGNTLVVNVEAHKVQEVR
jgi:hypothetical protein